MFRFVLKNYLFFLFIGLLQKPIFMLYHYRMMPIHKVFDVLFNGVPHDLAVAGYLSVIPLFALIIRQWWRSDWLLLFQRTYLWFVAIAVGGVYATDMVLYAQRDYRLDIYSSGPPASTGQIVWIVFLAIVYGIFIYQIGRKLLIDSMMHLEDTRHEYNHRIIQSSLGLLLMGIIFIPIRGGFGVSVMNSGIVYFSVDKELNHAALNPCFTWVESLVHPKDFSSKYRFFEDGDKVSEMLMPLQPSPLDPETTSLLKTENPNIVFIMMDGVMAQTMPSLAKAPFLHENVLVNIDSLAQEGVNFTNFYANSYSAQRSLLPIFSGLPALPRTIMVNYPHMYQDIASWPKQLKEDGYQIEYFYGGDVNYKNMRAYARNMGFRRLVTSNYFSMSAQASNGRGVYDEILFRKVMSSLKPKNLKEPFLRVVQTSICGDPFSVPYRRKGLTKPMNALAYSDSCVADFVKQLKETKLWDNTLVVITSDSPLRYPKYLDASCSQRYQIPFVLTGGALKEKGLVIDTHGSQQDIAATLFAQLGMSHDDFPFSQNLLDTSREHFAFFTSHDSFGIVKEEGEVIYNVSKQEASGDMQDKGLWIERGKALLQGVSDVFAPM